MAFKESDYKVEEWLVLENENILQKICNLYDDDNNLIAQYKTRVSVVPVGQYYGSIKSLSAPSLFRAFSYDANGNMFASIPVMREWTNECETAAVGAVPPSLGPIGGTPINPADPCCGQAGSEESDFALENISALRCVVKKINGIEYADVDTYANAIVAGVAITSGLTGETIKYKKSGVLYDSSFVFPLDDILYLSSNGIITNIEPISGILTKVGVSLGTGGIYIRVEQPIQL